MEISKTKRLMLKYPQARFYAFVAKGISSKNSSYMLSEERKKIEGHIKKSFGDYKESIEERSAFFKKYDKSFPIGYQLKTISEGKKIPMHSTIKDLFFMTELKNCLIMSAQDTDKLGDKLVFDVSDGEEDFVYMDGKHMKIKSDDIVLKQDDEILISHLYGMGKPSLVTEDTKNVLFMIWSDIGLMEKDIKNVEADLNRYLSIVTGKQANMEVFEVKEETSFIVTPWEVKGKVDYLKLIKDFGTTPLDDKLLARLKKHTKELHYFLTRKIFFSHRDFDKILDHYEKGGEFALYTGRGPSGDTHLGHLIPWILTKWFQDKFDLELYFEITDIEKYLVKDLTLDQTKRLAYENILDIIAVGFKPGKTFIFLDSEYGKTQFRLASEISKKITFSTAKAVFGFNNETNIGLIFHPAVQAAPCYLPTYLKKKPIPTFICAAIDQDNYWRVTRDVADKVGFPKPCQMHCSFMPGLGEGGKMSSSDQNSAIYTTDDPKTVQKKIMKYAFSGGRDTMEEHRRLGGNPDIDISYQYLKFFEEDDEKLKKIYNDYKSGKLLSGELKKICADKINSYLAEHQKRREWAKKHIEEFMLRD
jgi:tryptophanyl-tRNA synthetase